MQLFYMHLVIDEHKKKTLKKFEVHDKNKFKQVAIFVQYLKKVSKLFVNFKLNILA